MAPQTRALHKYLLLITYLFNIIKLNNINYLLNLIKGRNHTHSADGNDKLMHFAKDTFPLAVYGLQMFLALEFSFFKHGLRIPILY